MAGKMSKGNMWPLAIYSKANRIKMNVDTSRTQKASIAIVYDMKNWSSAVSMVDTRKNPKVVKFGGRTKYCRKHRTKIAKGAAATAR